MNGASQSVRGFHLVAGLALLGLLVVTCGALDRELQYDEPIYLVVAQQINATGKPLRHTFADLNEKQVFGNSPPLVLYFTAATQRFWPGNDLPSRLAQIFLIALPTFILIWCIAYRQFGAAVGAFALLLVLLSGTFLDEACRVRLDVPLALLSLLVLWAYHRAVESDSRWQLWLLLAAVAFVAAIWTKYQAVCIASAIGVDWLMVWFAGKRERFRRSSIVVGILVATGAFAAGSLWLYFDAISEGGFLAILRSNRGRIAAPDETWGIYLLREAVMLFRSVVYLGWPLLLLAITGAIQLRRSSSLARLLMLFCLVTLGFNVWSVRMPGAGNYYYAAMLPALVILAGAGGQFLWQKSNVGRVIVLALLVAQCYFNPPPIPSFGQRVNRFQAAANYIQEHSEPGDGVYSTDMSIEFYSSRPTGVMEYSPPEVVLESLRGAGPHRIQFVVLPMDGVPRQAYAGMLSPIWDEVCELLRTEFEPAPVDISGMIVLQRRAL